MYLTWRRKIAHAVRAKVVYSPRPSPCVARSQKRQVSKVLGWEDSTSSKQHGSPAWDHAHHGTMDALVNDARGALAACKPHTHSTLCPVLWAEGRCAQSAKAESIMAESLGSRGECFAQSPERLDGEEGLLNAMPFNKSQLDQIPVTQSPFKAPGGSQLLQDAFELALASQWPLENAAQP